MSVWSHERHSRWLKRVLGFFIANLIFVVLPGTKGAADEDKTALARAKAG
jgi:hypothetical protein